MGVDIKAVEGDLYKPLFGLSYSLLPIILEQTDEVGRSFEDYQQRNIGWRCLEAAHCLYKSMESQGLDVTLYFGKLHNGHEHYAVGLKLDDKEYLCDIGMLIDEIVELPKEGKSVVDLPSKKVELNRREDRLTVRFHVSGGATDTYSLTLTQAEIPDVETFVYDKIRLVRLEDGKIHTLNYYGPGRVSDIIIDQESRDSKLFTSLEHIAAEFSVDPDKLREANERLEAAKGKRPILF